MKQNTKSIKETQKQIDKQSKWLLKTSELSFQTWNLLLEVIDAFGNAAKIEENKKNEFRNEFRNEFKKSLDDLEGKMKKLSKLQILLQNMCDEKSPVKLDEVFVKGWMSSVPLDTNDFFLKCEALPWQTKEDRPIFKNQSVSSIF